MELAYKNLEKLGITDYAKKSFKELSGGQQQRVLLARTLCAAKSFLVLEEPAKGFDSIITEILYGLLEELNLVQLPWLQYKNCKRYLVCAASVAMNLVDSLFISALINRPTRPLPS